MEINVELLIGRKVVDVDGKVIGHIEEIVGREENGETVIGEYLIGRMAVKRRFSMRHLGYGFTALLGSYATATPGHPIAWHDMDVSDPEHPRYLKRAADLE